MSTPTPLRVALAGAPHDRERWALTLRGVEGTEVVQAGAGSPAELLDVFAREQCVALALTTATPELPAAVRAAVLAGLDVLVTPPVALASAQFASFGELARRRSRIIAFMDDVAADDRVRFVRRMTRGQQALWRPRSLRSLRVAEGEPLDELAMSEARLALELIGGTPERVFAAAPRIDDESGALEAVAVTLTWSEGAVASLQVSAIEPDRRRESVLACDGRTIVLDAYDMHAPLQIQAGARHGGPLPGAAWSEVVTEFPNAAASPDPAATTVCRFLAAVRSRDMSATNVSELAAAARTWEAARRSIASGMPEELAERERPAARPELRLIAGGGHGGGALAHPRLTVVRSQPAPFEPATPVA